MAPGTDQEKGKNPARQPSVEEEEEEEENSGEQSGDSNGELVQHSTGNQANTSNTSPAIPTLPGFSEEQVDSMVGRSRICCTQPFSSTILQPIRIRRRPTSPFFHQSNYPEVSHPIKLRLPSLALRNSLAQHPYEQKKLDTLIQSTPREAPEQLSVQGSMYTIATST